MLETRVDSASLGVLVVRGRNYGPYYLLATNYKCNLGIVPASTCRGDRKIITMLHGDVYISTIFLKLSPNNNHANTRME